MKAVLVLCLSIFSFAIIQHAEACSMSIDQLYQRNLLVGYAASELGIDLSKTSSIGVSDNS